MSQAYVIATISDIHWGAINAIQLFYELEEGFLKKLKELSILDAIIITGDLFDSKLSMNSEHSKLCIKFLSQLLDIAKEKNSKVRLIKGTESHDNKQLEILELIAKNYDFKVFNRVSSEKLFEDFTVLYIPEEYVTSIEEYYEYFFQSKYDMIFGHGLMNEVAFVASKQESEITMSKAPVFKSKTILSLTDGPIFFGHIHTPQVIKERIFYTGSFSRWCFGEEEDKGFYLVTVSPENSKFLTEFIVNKKAKKYDTILVDYNSAIFKESENTQIEYLVNIANNNLVDYLRMIINVPEDYPNGLLLTSMITEVFSKFHNIKTIINNNSKLRQKRETEEKVNLLLDKYGLIFDKTKSYEEKISNYIKIKYNKNIPIERVREYLYQKILKGDSDGN